MLPNTRHVRVERIILEDHRHVAVARANLVDDLAADFDVAGVGVLESGDGAKQRALAAAGRPDQHGELAVGNVEVDAANRANRAVALVQGANSDVRHLVAPHPLKAPSVSPRTRCRCTSIPSAIEGASEVVAKAQASPYCAP